MLALLAFATAGATGCIMLHNGFSMMGEGNGNEGAICTKPLRALWLERLGVLLVVGGKVATNMSPKMAFA